MKAIVPVPLVFAPIAFLLASCGSGIFGGVIASKQSGRSTPPPTVQIPVMTVSPARVALAPPTPLILTVTINNYRLPDELADSVSIALESTELGVRAVQPPLLLSRVQGSTTTLIFGLSLAAFIEAFATKAIALQDLDADLVLEVAGSRVATPTKVRVVRPLEFDSFASSTLVGAALVSVDGKSKVLLRAKQFVADKAADLSLGVLLRDYLVAAKTSSGAPNPDAYRLVVPQGKSFVCMQRRPDPPFGFKCLLGEVGATAPPARFPGMALLLVDDSVAGRLKPIDLVYEGSMSGISPGLATVVGGELSTIFGSGLLPAKNDTGTFEYLFDDITLRVRKAEGMLAVPPESIEEALSSEQRVVFHAPASPDGLPGTGEVQLEQRLRDGTTVRSVTVHGGAGASGRARIRYALQQPVLGPLVTILQRTALDAARGQFFADKPGSPPRDLSLLSPVDDFGQISLLRNHAAGLFLQAGAPVNTFESGFETARFPFRILSGQFDLLDAQDAIIVGGRTAAVESGQHALMRSTGNALEPFELTRERFLSDGNIADAATGDFSRDGRPEIVVLPTTANQDPSPELWSIHVGQVVKRRIVDPKGIAGGLLHVSDLNGDGSDDVAVATVESPFVVHVVFGDGQGAVNVSGHSVSFDPKVGTIVTDSPIALLSYPDPGQGRENRILCVVCSVRVGTKTSPMLVPLQFDPTNDAFLPPTKADTLVVSSTFEGYDFASSVDLVGSAAPEIVCAGSDATKTGFDVFKVGSGAPVVDAAAAKVFDAGISNPRRIIEGSLWEGGHASQAVGGFHLLHSERVDGKSTSVLSGFVRTKSGTAPRRPMLSEVADPEALVSGDFDGDGYASDCASLEGGILRVHLSKAVTVYDASPPTKLTVSAAISGTLSSFEWVDGQGDAIAWLETNGRLAILLPGRTTPVYSADLRVYLPSADRMRDLASESRIRVADADNDGSATDLCIFLKPFTAKPPINGMLVFLRRKVGSSSKVPFELPTGATGGLVVDSSLGEPAAGNLLSHGAGADRGIEVVLTGGSRLSFFTLAWGPKAGGHVFKRAPSPLVDFFVGPGTMRPVIADFDQESRQDIALVSSSDQRVQVLLNRIRRTGAGFDGSLSPATGPRLEFTGAPIGLDSGDMDGDGLRDLLVVAVIDRGATKDPALCLFRNEGRGNFAPCYVYPRTLFPIDDPKSFTLLDVEGNGIADLILGRDILLSR